MDVLWKPLISEKQIGKEKGYHPISTCLELALYLYKKLCSYRNGSSPRESKG